MPVADYTDGQKIGAAWITSETADGRPFAWHDGATGGFTSFVAVDRDAGVGVVLLSSSAVPVDEPAIALLRRAVREQVGR